MKINEQIVFLSYEQAQDLVDRISNRAERFDYFMSPDEKDAMAQLLSDIGVKIDDIVDVSNLADNYAINAEIVNDDESEHRSKKELEENCLFSFKDINGDTCYCLSW